MNDKISIVVPIYKVPQDLLKKSIENCINQTYKNIEIILVDDESPDDCGKICDEYAKTDARIKVIHQKNKGLSGARNSGVENSTGNWIMFLDGDDYIDVETCEILINSLPNEEIDIVCFGYRRESKNNNSIFELKGIEEKLYVGQECKYLQEKVLDFNAHFSSAYCKLMKREYIFNNNIFHNEVLKQGAEGIEFNIRLFEKADKVLVLKKYLYHYIYNEESISNKHNEKNHYFVLSCFDVIKEFIEKSDNKEKLLEALYNRMLYVIVTTAVSGYFSKGNVEAYGIKKKKFKEYLQYPLVKETLKKAKCNRLDIKRRCIIYLIKYKIFLFLNILSKFRKK